MSSTAWQLPQTPAEFAARAGEHGLVIRPDSVSINDAGLDYRVAYATATDGQDWVLRVPRRPGMADSIAAEAKVLKLVAVHLDVAVPQWRVAAEDLIAYPLLPGSPALTLADGEPVFHVDVASRRYALELGRLVGALHAIPAADTQAAGLKLDTVADVRAKHREDLERVATRFVIADDLLTRWRRWLDNDSYWPAHTAFTHGELYQAHVLVDTEDRITGVLDWTTATIGDPARDLAFQQMTAPPDVFEQTLDAYREAGGQTWPRLAEHCAEIVAFAPVAYGLYALTTGDPEHASAAQAMLTGPA